jgi:superfamily II DNA/RNA helicase
MENLSTYRHIPIVALPSKDSVQTSFAGMYIFKELLKGITDIPEYIQPMPIQQVSIVPCMQGKSMILHAPASSGKTTAICIAALQRINLNLTRCQVLIVTSCHEAAQKIDCLIQRLSVYFLCETFLCKDNDIKQRKFGNHIVIGTVMQVDELVKQNMSAMSHLRTLVLDSADDIGQLWMEGE